jgi:hypothetical protein
MRCSTSINHDEVAMNRIRSAQQGVAMAVVLLLMTIGVLVSLTGMGNARLEERIAGNQRQVSEAFMAAEAGLLHAAEWWQETEGGQRNDVRYWHDPAAAQSALAALDRTPRPGLQWFVRDLHFDGDIVTMTSVGSLDGVDTVRAIGARYQRPPGIGVGVPAPLTFGGPLAEFHLSESAMLEIDPVGLGASLPSVLTASEEDAQNLQAALNAEQMASLHDGIKAAPDPGERFSDPLLLQAFIEAVAQSPGVSDGSIPWDFGDPGNPTVNLVRGVSGEPADLVVNDRLTGAGILIVTGNLLLEQPPDFHGLVVVLGNSVTMGPGSGVIVGGLLMHPVADTAAEDWVSDPAGSRLEAEGSLRIQPDETARAWLQGLLSADALDLWDRLSGPGMQKSAGHLFGWFESPAL